MGLCIVGCFVLPGGGGLPFFVLSVAGVVGSGCSLVHLVGRIRCRVCGISFGFFSSPGF